MCGRYTLTTTPRRLAEHFHLDGVPAEFAPRHNIAPTQSVPIVRQVEGLGRHLDWVHWGLVPSWAEDPHIGNRLINARAETVAHKPAFRSALRHRRCLIPCDGFYEWKPTHGAKQPYWIGLQDRAPFAFAGLWEHWESKDGEEVLESCTIITTDANDLVAQLHDRMPAILTPDEYDRWLEPAGAEGELVELLRPCFTEDMIAYPVSRNVNNPRNDSPDLLLPVQGD